MLDKLKSDFDKILELVNKVPAPLQELAFKIILEQWFRANTELQPAPSTTRSPLGTIGSDDPQPALPAAVRKFLTANGITMEMLEKAFHPTGPGAQLLTSSIPGNGKANKLVSLSVLICVKQAIESGNFSCTLKELRELAIHYDCYDSANFSKTLKANKNNYKPREKGAALELSGPGLRRASETIKSIVAEQ